MIPIVYCGNKGIFEGLFLSAVSVAMRTDADLDVRIISMEYTKGHPRNVPIDKEQIELLDKALKTFNPNNRAQLFDYSKEFVRDFEGGKNVKTGYTPYAFLRLYMDDPEFIPYDKAIYLDTDTMCNRDIKELFDIDVSDYEYAANPDYMGRFWIRKDYCNSGVLLVNCKMIRENGLFKKCRELLYRKHYLMPDQSALDALSTKRLYLGDRFNEQRALKPETVIKHFNKGMKWFPIPHLYNVKQWHREDVHNKLKIFAFDKDFEFYDKFMKENAKEKD